MSKPAPDSKTPDPGNKPRNSSLLRPLTVVGALLTCVSFFGHLHWLFDLIAHFRVQLAIGASVILICFLVTKRWQWALICLAGVLVNAWPVAPYLIPGQASQPIADIATKPLKLLTLNVLTRNRQWQSVVDLILAEDPDFVVLMEVDSVWELSLIHI